MKSWFKKLWQKYVFGPPPPTLAAYLKENATEIEKRGEFGLLEIIQEYKIKYKFNFIRQISLIRAGVDPTILLSDRVKKIAGIIKENNPNRIKIAADGHLVQTIKIINHINGDILHMIFYGILDSISGASIQWTLWSKEENVTTRVPIFLTMEDREYFQFTLRNARDEYTKSQYIPEEVLDELLEALNSIPK